MPNWKELMVASLGGGALYELTDQFIGKMLPTGTILTGITMKDVAEKIKN